MNTPISILLLEDVVEDAELIERELQKGGITFTIKRVDKKESFQRELKNFAPAFILADYKLPSFDGISALAIAQKECPDTPFIFVSGTIREEMAIEALKKGASDYVYKYRLSKLVPSVKRALKESCERAALKISEQVKEKALHDLAERVKELNFLYTVTRIFVQFDLSPQEIIQQVTDLIPSAFQYPEKTCARLIVEGKEFRTNNFSKRSHWRLSSDILVSGEKAGIMEVYFLDETAKSMEEQFLSERQNLIKDLGIQLGIIIEHRNADDAIRQSENKYRTLIENLPQKIFLKDKNSVYISCNENYAQGLKIKPEEVKGKTDYDFYSREIAEKYRADDQRIMELGDMEEVEEEYIQNGNKLWVHTVKIPVRDERGNVTSILGIFWDITERKKMEQRIEYLAYYDALTGLPNRNLFIDRFKQGIERAELTSKLAVVVITDINRFNSINDTYGNEVGDKVLKDIAERLTNTVRKGDTVARFGDDQFGIALLDIDDINDVIPLLEKIVKEISSPFNIGGDEMLITFSYGISVYPHDSKDPMELLKLVGLALEAAKKEGSRSYHFYTNDLNIKASEFILMVKNLYNAIKNEEFFLLYQPYFDINTQKLVGYEALIRWESKDIGLVLPGKFIPVLEETGMIIEVGEWILREAMKQVKEWQNKGYPIVPVSVNISLIQFKQKDLVQMIGRVIKEVGFYPSLLNLEITESAFMHDIEFTNLGLKTLKKMGCSVSIDDFGTGWSSLAYLKRFPIDNLKIDISFIREIVKDPDTASIVMAIINMAHALNLKTTAEGIETEEQCNFLRLLRCDIGQGFYLSKPLPAEEVEKLLEQR
jgi:diguanylate cyclase (GGDEF)-like protein/PAS domain S-box-containing protein